MQTPPSPLPPYSFDLSADPDLEWGARPTTPKEEIEKNLDPKNYTGRSASQVTEFINGYVKPAIEKYSAEIETEAELKV